MSGPIYQAIIDNPMGEITTWDDHQKLAVVVDHRWRYNGLPVPGHVRIIQLCLDDLELLSVADGNGEHVHADELDGTSIVTNVAGARQLAAVLLAAADKAEQVPA